MKRLFTVSITLLGLAGCAVPPGGVQSQSTPPPVTQTSVQKVKSDDGRVNGEIVGFAGPGSKFDRLRIGMSQREVEDLVGPPSDSDGHITGKQFIPFYFGGDAYRNVAFYKRMGRLEFAPTHFAGAANVLVRIVNNPDESGYAH